MHGLQKNSRSLNPSGQDTHVDDEVLKTPQLSEKVGWDDVITKIIVMMKAFSHPTNWSWFMILKRLNLLTFKSKTYNVTSNPTIKR